MDSLCTKKNGMKFSQMQMKEQDGPSRENVMGIKKEFYAPLKNIMNWKEL